MLGATSETLARIRTAGLLSIEMLKNQKKLGYQYTNGNKSVDTQLLSDFNIRIACFVNVK